MAIKFRTKETSALSSATWINVAFTTVTGDGLLVAFYSSATTATRSNVAFTWNSVDMVQAGTSQAGSAECNSELWYMTSPNIGASTIAVRNSSAKESRVMVAAFSGSNVSLFGTPQQTGTSSTFPNLTINSVPVGGLVTAVLGHGRLTSPSNLSHTSLYSYDEGAYSTSSQYGELPTGGNVTMSWTVAASDDVAMIMAAFEEPAEEPPPISYSSNVPCAIIG